MRQATLAEFGIVPAPKVKNPKYQRFLARKTGRCPVCGAKLTTTYDPDEEDGFVVEWLTCPRCGFACPKEVRA